MKILLTIAYDGTKYYGWQYQNGFITVQGEVEKALSKLFNTRVDIRGASRTDKGVHALGQRATFEMETSIPLSNLPYAINNLLPEDIRVHKAEEVEQAFHPQYNAINKTYAYKIYNAAFHNPLLNNYAWHINKELDITKMKEASKHIIGEHDFSAFCASGATSKTRTRTVNSLEIYKQDNIITIEINGNAFLYNMVRIITGTLVYIGYGKLQPNDMPIIISSLDRAKAGITAPPQGLSLMYINYS